MSSPQATSLEERHSLLLSSSRGSMGLAAHAAVDFPADRSWRRVQRDAFVFAFGAVVGCAALFALSWTMDAHQHRSSWPQAEIIPLSALADADSCRSLAVTAVTPESGPAAAPPPPPLPPPPAFGVVFVVYGDSLNLPAYLSEAVVSARSYRAHSPTLPIALIVSEPEASDAFFAAESNRTGVSRPLPSPFTSVIRIPSYWLFSGRQWLTRLYVMLHLLPYTHSLVVDSDTFACGDVAVPLRLISSSPSLRTYGFAVNSHSSSSMSPDNGVMLVHANSSAWLALARQWIHHYWQLPLTVTADDQAALRSAIPTLQRDTRTLHSIGADPAHAVGWLSNALSCRFLPGLNQTWRTDRAGRRFERTLVLDGPVYVFHRRSPVAIHASVCAVVNSNHSLRVLLWKDHWKFPPPKTPKQVEAAFELAFSQDECERKLEGKCARTGYWQKDDKCIKPMPMQKERKPTQGR